ncbi:uncharacterized protein LOC124309478 [Neodiprion virginianus]|uniref:uncharacterized protein LOC124309478 n=1 Tax=Neodiprion virginianus TaxID=2961670 RepID=UPI001EE780E1|nr:uncharacterized protein LOC124309478 [Neodiprion virginianus]
MDFANKVALITGGAGGIGFQSAKELLRNGLKHVAILDLASSPGEELADKLNAEFGKGRAIFVSCDVTKANELEAAFAKTVNEFGGLDIVINNAGILNESKWELTIDINLIAVVRGTMLALQYMGKDKGGKGGVIVNTSSTYGVDPVAWSPAYAAAKAGVVGLSRSYGLSYHYDKTGVRVITMCPSFTETQLLIEADDSRLLLFEDAKAALNEINNGLMQKLVCTTAIGDMQVEKKIALVTGGARGIGFAYATEHLRNGAAHVAILDLATSPGLEAANKLNVEFGDGRAIFIECDVTKDIEFKAAFDNVIEELGGLDIVINNAGIANESQYDLTININLTAVVRGTILGLQHMGKDKGGKGGVIVNTSSIYGLDPEPWLPVYVATKHGVVGLSRSFGSPYHYEKTGVRVMTICPSFTNTRLLAEVGDNLSPFVDKEAAMNAVKGQSFQKPENVGKALVDIISRGNSGSVWISEAGEPVVEIFIPDRFTLVASSRKQPFHEILSRDINRELSNRYKMYEKLRSISSFRHEELKCPGWERRKFLFGSSQVSTVTVEEDMQVEKKIALVTGGARGIGFAYATELLRNGAAHVAILDLATSPGLEAANKLNVEFGDGRAIFIECDVTKDIEFKAAFVKVIEELGGLDIVINNAGIVNESQYDLTININLTAVVRGTILGLQHMGKDKGGKGGVIVNTASIYGLDPGPWLPVYGATKHGVVGLSRSFGLPYHYEKTGVKVLAMCPSFTDTKLLNEIGDCTGPFVDKEAAMNDIKNQSLQKPENVGKALVDIISRGNSGSVWISEAGEPVVEIFIPDRFTLVASSRKQP